MDFFLVRRPGHVLHTLWEHELSARERNCGCHTNHLAIEVVELGNEKRATRNGSGLKMSGISLETANQTSRTQESSITEKPAAAALFERR
jgi:hypothetical protein